MAGNTPKVSGTEPGQRQLNGPQTTGREYRNLSEPRNRIVSDLDVAVPMRDGINLMVDVHRPRDGGSYPVLIAASPYPRQIQDIGAPMGFIEAGATDFFVPEGMSTSSPTFAARAARRVPSASMTPRSVSTCTTSSNGQRSNPGPMAGWDDRYQLLRHYPAGGGQ